MRIVALIVLLVSSCMPGLVSGNTEAAAEETVRQFHASLESAMRQADVLGFSGRRDMLAPEITERFDIPFISSMVTGRYWETLDDAERDQMIDTFGALTVATYAARFDAYSGEQFKVLELKPLNKGRVMVKTQLSSPGGREVTLDYVLHADGENWRIINVIADGVSELSIKRSDYSNVLKTMGFETLISKLKAQIEALEPRS